MGKPVSFDRVLLTAKLAINRAKIWKAKKAEASAKTKKEVADLIVAGKDTLARIKVMSVVFDDYLVEVFSLCALYCQTIVTRIDVLKASPKACPKELLEAVCSIVYAAPYLEGQRELLELRLMFIGRYGKDFPRKCVNENCVSAKLVQRLAKKKPADDLLDYYMQAISEKHNVSLPDADQYQAVETGFAAGLEPGVCRVDAATGNRWIVAQDPELPLVYVAAADAKDAGDGDEVLFSLKNRADSKKQGVIEEITHRREPDAETIEARLARDGKTGHTWAIDVADAARPLVFVPPDKLADATAGDLVSLVVTARPDGKFVGSVALTLERASAGVEEFEARVKFDANTGHAWALDLHADKPVPAFISPDELNGAGDGDHALVQVRPASKPGGTRPAKVLSILERAPVAGVLAPAGANGGHALTTDTHRNVPIVVAPADANGAAAGDRVLVQPDVESAARALDGDGGGAVRGRVIQILERAPITGRMRVDDVERTFVEAPASAGGRRVHVPLDKRAGAAPGDKVRVGIEPGFLDGHLVGKVLEIVERAPKPVIVERAKIVVDPKTNNMWAKDQASGSKVPLIYVAPADARDASDKDFVRIELHIRTDGKTSGRVLSVLERAPPPAYTEAVVGANVPPPPPLMPADYGRKKRAASSAGGPSTRVAGTMSARALASAAAASRAAGHAPVVLDTGSGQIKIGMAGEELPRAVFPAVVGRPKFEGVMVGMGKKELYIGDDAQAKRGILSLRYPIEHGIVTNWDDMEAVWNHALYNEMRVKPDEHPIVLTEAPLNPRRNRERMAEFFFEKMNTPALYIGMQAVLGLYATGRTTGVVMDIGDGVSHCVPVYEGYALPHAVERLDVAGRDVTEHLRKLLREQGYKLNSTAEFEVAREIKEQCAYVARDYKAELKNAKLMKEKLFEMPDGQIIAFTDQAFRCAEPLFTPSLIGLDEPGVASLVTRSIKKTDKDLHMDLYRNVVLSGGTTMLPGMAERMHADLSATAPPNTTVKVVADARRKYAVWSGAAALASLSSFDKMWLDRDAYLEGGNETLWRYFL